MDNEELYFTKRLNGSITDEKVNNLINDLKEYIEKDKKYIDYNKIEGDFDRFCYNHCKDIETILNELKYKEEKIKELEEKNKELIQGQVETLDKILKPELSKKYISKDKIREKIKELESIEPADDDYNFELQNDIHSKLEVLQELLQEGDDK